MIRKKFLWQMYWQNILSKKWLISFLIFTVLSAYTVVQINNYAFTLHKSFNVFDAYFYQFGLQMFIFLGIAPIYLINVSDIMKGVGIENFIYIRFSHKLHIWLNEVLLLVFITITYLFKIIMINFIISVFSLNVSFSWSQGNKALKDLIYINDFNFINANFFSVNPLLVAFISIILLFLYLLFLGIVSQLVSFLFKKKFVGLLTGILLNIAIFATSKLYDLFGHSLVSPYDKISIRSQNLSSIWISISYWVGVLAVLLILYFINFKKTDYIFEVKGNDV